jgi:hypothetical protein
VAVLDHRDGHAVSHRAVGLAARRPPPDRQLLRARRPGGDDADVLRLGAGRRARAGKYKGTAVLQDEQRQGARVRQRAHGGAAHGRSSRSRRRATTTCPRRSRTTSCSTTPAFRPRHCRPRSRRSSSTSCTSSSARCPRATRVKMADVRRHIGQTHFAWIGGTSTRRGLLLPDPQPGDPDRVRSPAAGRPARARRRPERARPRPHPRRHPDAERQRLREGPAAAALREAGRTGTDARMPMLQRHTATDHAVRLRAGERQRVRMSRGA